MSPKNATPRADALTPAMIRDQTTRRGAGAAALPLMSGLSASVTFPQCAARRPGRTVTLDPGPGVPKCTPPSACSPLPPAG